MNEKIFIDENHIKLYHFCRGFKDDYLKNGLQILNREKQIKYFLSKAPKNVRLEQILLNKENTHQEGVRVGRLSLVTSKYPDGTETLTSNFGGEYIRRLISNKSSEDFFENELKIGLPLRISIKININKIDYPYNDPKTFIEIENGTFSGGGGTDLHISTSIIPKNILEIEVLSENELTKLKNI